MTTDTWTAGSDNWTATGSDWSLGSPPTPSEDAFIGTGSGGTVVSDANETVNSIGIASGYTLDVEGMPTLPYSLPSTFRAATGTGASQSIAGSIVIADGVFEASSQLVNTGTIELVSEAGEDGFGSSLEVSGNLAIDQTGGQILIQGNGYGVGSEIVSDGTAATLNLNGGMLVSDGKGQVGDSNLTLNIGQGTIVDANGTLVLDTSSNVISNNGVLEATNGGTLSIESPVSNNNGTILAAGGTVSVYSDVDGGNVEIGGGIYGASSTLSVASTGYINGNVQFAGPNANLYISATDLIGGSIIGLEPGDVVHESSLTFAAGDHAVWSQNGSSGTLTIENSSGSTLATLMLAGEYTSGEFKVTGGSNDLQITVAAPVYQDDFNGDGTSDMLWRSANGAMAEWLMDGSAVSSISAPTYNGSAVTPDSSWNIAAIADFDAAVSRDADILWRNGSSGSLIDWQMNGDNIVQPSTVTYQGNAATPDSSWSVAGTGDFNGDGNADILWRQSSTGALADWSMSGATVESGPAITYQGQSVTPDSTWAVAGIGDFSGNGKDEILWRQSSTGATIVWDMTGSTIQSSANVTYQGNPVTPDSSWSVVGIGDFNGAQGATQTNVDDILWQNSNTGSLAMWLMNGSTIETAATVTYQGNAVAPDSTWKIVEVGEFNGSSEEGIIWQQSTTGAIVEWQMNGAQIVSSSSITQALIPLTQTATSQANPTDV